MTKLLLLLLVVLFSTHSLAQKNEGESEEDYKRRVLQELGVSEVKEEAPSEDQADNQDESQNDNQNENENAENQQDKNLEGNLDQAMEDMANMGGMDKTGEPVEVKNKKVTPIKIKDSFFTKMMNSQTKVLLGTLMVQSPFKGMKREQLEAIFIAKNEGNPLGALLKKNETVKNILMDFLMHEKALPNIVSLINKPEKLKFLGIFMAIVLGLAFAANLTNTKGNIIKRVLFKFAIGGAVGLLNFGCVVYLFYDELTPTISIVFKHIHI